MLHVVLTLILAIGASGAMATERTFTLLDHEFLFPIPKEFRYIGKLVGDENGTFDSNAFVSGPNDDNIISFSLKINGGQTIPICNAADRLSIVSKHQFWCSLEEGSVIITLHAEVPCKNANDRCELDVSVGSHKEQLDRRLLLALERRLREIASER